MLLTLGLLLMFQGFRVASGGFLDEFIMQCTSFGNSRTILFLIGMIYWSFDKKLGEYLLVSFSFAGLWTHLQNLRHVFTGHGYQTRRLFHMREH